MFEYLSNTWLIYKYRFVNAWTSRYLRFGNKATSRVKGAHAYVKTFLQVSTGDLMSVLSKLTLGIDHQVRTEETRRSRDKLLHLTGLPSTFTPVSGGSFQTLHSKMSRSIQEEHKRKSLLHNGFHLDIGHPLCSQAKRNR